MQRLLMLLMIAMLALAGCQPIQAPATTGAPATESGSTVAAVDLQQPIPTDPAVRIGKLDNGLTYYVRENHEPKAARRIVAGHQRWLRT